MEHGTAAYAWADDLSWIVGRLQHEQLEGGFWSLEFGDAEAPHGGRVVLGTDHPALAHARTGALARVTGAADPERMTIWMAGTVYELESLELLDEAEAGG